MENRPVSMRSARLWTWLLGIFVTVVALIVVLEASRFSAPASAAASRAADWATLRTFNDAVAAAPARSEQETETPTDEPPEETATPEESEEPTEAPTQTPEPSATPDSTMPPLATATAPIPPTTPESSGSGARDDKVRLGYIKGVAFIDLDQDGTLDPDDPGLNDVGVHLVGGGLDLLNITGATGQFSFDGLGAGRYDVFIAPGPEWRVTTKSRYDGVRVRRDVVQGVDFGLTRVGAAPVASGGKPKAGKHGLPSLPKTGIAAAPATGMLALVTVVLGLIAATGWAIDRRR
jgi:hypothetical protein